MSGSEQPEAATAELGDLAKGAEGGEEKEVKKEEEEKKEEKKKEEEELETRPGRSHSQNMPYRPPDQRTIGIKMSRQVSVPVGPKEFRKSKVSSSSITNGDQDDYYSDPFDMDEPFSDDDDETHPRRRLASRPKLNLPLPRARIRTLSGTVPAVGYAPVWGGPTMCLSCLEFFDLPAQTNKYTTHLLEKHTIVITDIEYIVDLKRYVEHWRHRFSKEKVPIEDIFPKVEPKEGEPLHGRVDFYFLMSDKIPEDRKLRHTLAMRRLEEVLSCQQREREDVFFSMQCLFCRYTARGNRSKLIHHLYMIHHLNLGSPDNLVFVAEYIDLLHDKIKRNECIYCEKTFGDRTNLMEHMRKRGHREVNPKNNYYDKFYIINYLELGKKWLDVLAEDFEDQMPTFADSDEEEEEESWNEWQQDTKDEAETLIVCLFCDEAFDTVQHLQEHMSAEHKFDMLSTFERLDLNFYERVKLINYIRKSTYQCVCFVCGKNDLHSWPALRKHLNDNDHIVSKDAPRDRWDLDDYLVSIFDNDHLLWVLESSLIEKEGSADLTLQPTSPVSTENGPETVIAEDLPDLQGSELDRDPELLASLR